MPVSQTMLLQTVVVMAALFTGTGGRPYDTQTTRSLVRHFSPPQAKDMTSNGIVSSPTPQPSFAEPLLSPTPAPVPTSSSTLSPTTLSATESTAIALDGSTPTTPTATPVPIPGIVLPSGSDGDEANVSGNPTRGIGPVAGSVIGAGVLGLLLGVLAVRRRKESNGDAAADADTASVPTQLLDSTSVSVV